MFQAVRKQLLFFILIGSCTVCFSNGTSEYISGNVKVVAEQKDMHYAEKLLEALNKNIDLFQKRIGHYPDLSVIIRITSDKEEYLDFTGRSSGIIEFSQAFFGLHDKIIYIKNPAELKDFASLNRIILHEYIHLFVHSHWINAPLWFSEGMAVYFSYDLNLDREFNFVINYILGNSRNLTEMKTRYPRNRIEWESFYAKSGLAVKYLYNKKRAGFYQLWENAVINRDFNRCFFKAFLQTPGQFSREFENYSKSHFTMEILLASTGLIWMIFPLILLLAGIRKRIRNKGIERKWEDEDFLEEIEKMENE